MAPAKFKKKNIVFFHPDLGIGGAERLVVDAAVALKNRGHTITIFTSHCDPSHCFEECRDGTLDVRVRGNSIVPSTILSRFAIICAILRQFHLILQLYISGELSALKPDAFFVDQLSAGLPILRSVWPETRVFFYCHFPDLLLAQGRSNWIKRIYRIPFDQLEQWSMSFADSIAVNSGFTKGMVEGVFPELAKKKDLQVVHPCVDVSESKIEDDASMWRDRDIILSINRFEKKKDIGLAIKAFAGLGKHGRENVRLVCAGGYDNRVQENVTYHKELIQLAESLGLKTATTKTVVTAMNVPDDVDVLFLLSVPNTLKTVLLKSARLLVYTPQNEHFGIVPLEAMLVGLPVLAANSGGPLETVVEGKTGWLCPPSEISQWTSVMDKVLHKLSKAELQKIAEAGKKRVTEEFSDTKMGEKLDQIIENMSTGERASVAALQLSAAIFAFLFFNVIALGIVVRIMKPNWKQI